MKVANGLAWLGHVWHEERCGAMFFNAVCKLAFSRSALRLPNKRAVTYAKALVFNVRKINVILKLSAL